MKGFRRFFIFTAMLCMSLMLPLTVSAVSDSATDDSTDGAVLFTPGDTLNGSITETDNLDYYQFNLSTSGKITLKMTSYMRYYCIRLLGSNGTEIWYTDYNEWTSSVGFRTDSYNLYLEAGKYYMQINGYRYNTYNKSTGTYVCETTFVSSNTTNKESDNTTATANELTLGNTYVGQISITDNLDYYKFTLPSDGRLTLNMTSYMQYYCILLYDQDGKQIWYTDYNEWTSSVGYRNDVYNLYLDAGFYYMQINGYRYNTYNKSTGKYVIGTGFISSGSSFTGDDNSFAAAKSIALGQKYTGQISINDDFDTYRFSVSAKTFPLNIISYMQYYCIKVFDSDGKQVWETRYNEWNKNVGYRKDTHTLTLDAGTYYMQINGYRYNTYNKSTGKYEFTVGSSGTSKQPTDNHTNSDTVKPTEPSKTTGKVKMSAKSIVMRKNQATTALKVTQMPAGSKIASVSSNNKNVVKIVYVRANGLIKLKARKTGNAKITVELTDGKKAVVKVKVQSGRVKTTAIKGVKRKLSLKKGQSFTLEPQLKPITSQDKLKYKSSNKRVASVNAKGKITAKKKGTAIITIRSGRKQVTCRITVK